jgi:ElaB/YqjD/DUF883 family membrane-anchored ribosome-binding protein
MNAADITENLQNRAVDMSRTAKDKFVHGTQQFMERSKDVARSMDNCVHDHTWAAVGVAAAVGIILGLAISRR